MEEDKIIDLHLEEKFEEDTKFKISAKAASNSLTIKGLIEDYPEDKSFVINTIKKNAILKKVVEYLNHIHEKPKEISTIEKPLKSNNFEKCISQWEKEFLNIDINEIIELYQAASFLNIRPLIDLIAAKCASRIRDITTEIIRKEFKIGKLTDDEEQFIRKQKEDLINYYLNLKKK